MDVLFFYYQISTETNNSVLYKTYSHLSRTNIRSKVKIKSSNNKYNLPASIDDVDIVCDVSVVIPLPEVDTRFTIYLQ